MTIPIGFIAGTLFLTITLFRLLPLLKNLIEKNIEIPSDSYPRPKAEYAGSYSYYRYNIRIFIISE